MKRRTYGFTIVELATIIVTLGILISIVAVGWSATAAWSRDRGRESDVSQWMSTFDLYKSRYTVWPALPANDTTPKALCLGVPLSGNNKCIQSNGLVQYNGTLGTGTYSSSLSTDPDFASLTTEVKKIGNFPVSDSQVIKNTAGPFVFLWSSSSTSGSSTTVTVYAHFINFFETACNTSSGYTRIITSPSPVLPSAAPGAPATQITPAPPASYALLFTGVPATTYACFIPKSITYTITS